MRLHGLLHAAVGAFGGQPGFFRRHAAALEIVGEQGEVRFHFASEFPFRAPIAEQASHPGKKSFPQRHGHFSTASSLSTTTAICRQRSVSSSSAFRPARVMA